MSLIVDASIAIKWFVAEERHEQARALLFTHGGSLEAPDLLIPEVANIAWKKVLRSEITPAQAIAIVREAPDYLVARHDSIDLVERATEIALDLRHPVYDCFYVACAERIRRSLVTADARLHRAVRNSAFAGVVHLLGEDDPIPAPVR